MTNNLPAITDLPLLPPQVRLHFPEDMTEKQEYALRLFYSGQKAEPSFIEWVEDYLANDLVHTVEQGKNNLNSIVAKLEEHKSKEPRYEQGEAWKQWRNELKALESAHKHTGAQRFDFMKELRVLVQGKLSREQPKKIEMTQVKVTPGDVANLIDNARRVVDVNKSE